MRKGSMFFSFIFCVLVLGFAGTAFSQTLEAFKIPIFIQVTGVTKIDTLWFGIHGDGPNPPGVVNDNTYGPDVDSNVVGAAWKEFNYPPDPQLFDFISKWIQIPFRTALPPDGIAGTGIKPNDFRGYTSSSQIDTFCLNVYGDGTTSMVSNGPVTLSWPSGLSTVASRIQLKKRASGNNYNLVVSNMGGDTLTWEDANAAFSNNIRYLIVMSGLTGVGVEKQTPVVPAVFKLEQNYPNPFNPKTQFSFSVANKEMSTVRLYNILGQEVMTLFNGITVPGTMYKVEIDGNRLASGVYFYRLTSGSQSDIKKMVLLK